MRNAPPPPRQLPRGFTLIELLTVIAIIAILAALLMPALTATRSKSYQMKCLSNLRQLCAATVLCANDNNGRFPALKGYEWDSDGYMNEPSATPWYQAPTASPMGVVLAPYLGITPVNTVDVSPNQIPAIFKCPAAAANAVNSWINQYPSYRYNGYAAGRRAASAIAIQNAMLYIDAAWGGGAAGGWAIAAFSHQDPAGIHAAYGDGHVAFLSYNNFSLLDPNNNGDYQSALYLNGWFQ